MWFVFWDSWFCTDSDAGPAQVTFGARGKGRAGNYVLTDLCMRIARFMMIKRMLFTQPNASVCYENDALM